MAALAILIVIYAFLLIGAFMFLNSFATRPLRKYALSVALWCAAMGPCLVALILFAGLALIAGSLTHDTAAFDRGQLPMFGHLLWKTFGVLGLISAATTCTLLAWFHQFVIHRMTFALFRLYATAVCTGMGTVWAILLALCLGDIPLPYRIPIWIFGSIILCVAFGYLGFRSSHSLRGSAPETLTWLTTAEFEGSSAN